MASWTVLNKKIETLLPVQFTALEPSKFSKILSKTLGFTGHGYFLNTSFNSCLLESNQLEQRPNH